jgi:hypothetical protein
MADPERLRSEFRKGQAARAYLDAYKQREWTSQKVWEAVMTNPSDQEAIEVADAIVKAEEAEQEAREAFIRATSG